ncbi:MAG: ribonuclease Z [Bacteroidales bacterium]|nr:ribonuclease Z [Bacteroidales bacterium]
MTFSVTVLGSSSALPTSSRYPTAHLLNAYERFFLIDCGEGTQIQLRKFRMKFSKINHVFISHLHGDHYFGLFGLLSSMSLLGRSDNLHIYSHSELKNILDFQLKYYHLGFEIVFHELIEGKIAVIYEDKQIQVTTFPLNHRIASNGFLFKEKTKEKNIRKEMVDYHQLSIRDIVKIKKGEDFIDAEGNIVPNENLTHPPFKQRAYAFCSDTAFDPSIVPVIEGVDILYHESTFADDMKIRAQDTAHSTAKQAAEIAKMANVRKLLLGHFSARYTDLEVFETEARQIFKNSFNVIEGQTYSVELEREYNS